MNRGNIDKVMVDAKKIAHRLRKTNITLEKLIAEYHCSYHTIIKAVCSQIPEEEWLEIRHKRLIRGNRKKHFPKGHIPWNKGLKGYCPSGLIKFKKGHLPASAKELGTITVHRDKRNPPIRMIAIAGPTPVKHNWITYAQYLWEKEHGPVPKGFFVVHEDGRSLNDQPENLVVVDRKGNLELIHKNNPNWRKKATNSLLKTYRRKRREKAQIQLETDQKKMMDQHMLKIHGLQVCIWECSGCAAEYEGENPPINCIKCGGFSFEKNFYRRKTG